ncbi:MAG: c-type cytochrome [Planctomycetaceae bacterium]|nr:c-type cytochrome [Planctomycetaceae bacterium]
MKRQQTLLGLAALLFALTTMSAGAQDKKITFEEHIKPVFRQHCATCHNPDKKSGGLDLTNYLTMMQGGSSGAVVEGGDAELSYLYMLITHESEPYMPPNSDKIPAEQIELIAKWINGGLLETSSSKAKLSNKPKMDLSLDPNAALDQRPETVAMPNYLSLQPVIRTSTTTTVNTIATSPWAPLAAIAGQKQILLYNTKTLELAGVLPFPEGEPQILKFSRNGSLLLAGGGHSALQGKVVIFNVTTGERVITVGDELDTVLAADISADQTKIALGGPQKMIRIYSTADGSLLHEIKKHTDWIYSMEFSPDGVLLATADRVGGLHVWDPYTGRNFLSLPGHKEAITSMSWISAGNTLLLATGSEDGKIAIWDMSKPSENAQIKNFNAHGGGVTSVEYTRDGRIVSCGRDKVAKLWDANGKQLKSFGGLSDIATAVSFCDETNRVIAGDWTGLTKVWNAEEGQDLGQVSTNPLKIEERIAQLQAQVDAQTKDYQAKAAAAKPLVEALNKLKADLAKAQELSTTSKKTLDETTAFVNKLKAQVDTLTKEKTAADQQVASLTPVTASLKTAMDQTAAAAQKLSDDKNLAALAAQAKAQHDQKAATLAAQQKIQAEKAAALKKTTEEKAVADKKLQDATAAYQAAVKTQQNYEAMLKPTTEKADAATAAMNQSQQVLASRQQELKEWQTQLTLSQKLDEMKAKEQTLAEKKLAEAENKALLDTAQTELAKAQQTAATAKENLDKIAAELEAEKKTLATQTGQMNAMNTQHANLEKALPMIAEAAKKAQEVAAQLKDDKELAASAKALGDLVTKRSGELANLKKAIEAKQAEVADQTAKIAGITKQMQAAQADQTAAQKVVAEKSAAMKPVQEKYTASQTETAKATQARDAVKKEVDGIRAQLAPLVGNEQASIAK